MAVKAAADILSTGAGYRNRWSFMVIFVLTAMLFPLHSQAQQTDTSPVLEEMGADTDNRVEVQPISSDDAIKVRLTNIMVSTGWFDNIQVEVLKVRRKQQVALELQLFVTKCRWRIFDVYQSIDLDFFLSKSVPKHSVEIDI